ncbi:MAG: DUF4296 domain-containing protein [Alistipes sp.]|nr:DUF4296 domain-containing protein [Alistipes sp.]
MKRGLIASLVVSLLLGMSACRKHTVIPDSTLADIFHDAFVANAYIGVESINLDSLQIYEPIFERYGYTAKDVAYTVGNFSRRKSARLGTVVEQAISRLEKESAIYKKRVVILDTIRDVAVRSLSRIVYEDTLIVAKRRSDSTRLRIVIKPVLRGEYTITYESECKDDLERYPRSSIFYFADEEGNRNSHATITMHESDKARRTLTLNHDTFNTLVLEFGQYNLQEGKRPPKRQDLKIRNLKVRYKPNEQIAIDSLYERYMPIKIFADGFLIKKDSLTLSADTTRVESATPHNR